MYPIISVVIVGIAVVGAGCGRASSEKPRPAVVPFVEPSSAPVIPQEAKNIPLPTGSVK